MFTQGFPPKLFRTWFQISAYFCLCSLRLCLYWTMDCSLGNLTYQVIIGLRQPRGREDNLFWILFCVSTDTAQNTLLLFWRKSHVRHSSVILSIENPRIFVETLINIIDLIKQRIHFFTDKRMKGRDITLAVMCHFP